MEIGIILLAAGSSSRMGEPKQLLLIQGEPLLVKSVKASVHSKASQVLVVLGSNYEKHKAVIRDLQVDIIENKEWQKGMGNSLKKGLSHLLLKTNEFDGVLVLVCDQPFLSAAVINSLINRFEGVKSKIVASRYEGIVGVPALFSSSLFDEILRVEDEQGAKKIILQHQDQLSSVEFAEGIIDLDTPTDYENFLRY